MLPTPGYQRCGHSVSVVHCHNKGYLCHPESYTIYEPPIAEDHVIQNLIEVTLKRWPEQKSDTDYDVCAYYNVKLELYEQNGLMFRDSMIVVLTSLCKDSFATVRRSHRVVTAGKGRCLLHTDKPIDH